jgi:hypothetical protein
VLRREVAGWFCSARAADRLASENPITPNRKTAEPGIRPCSAADLNRSCAEFYLVVGGAGVLAAAAI